MFFSLAVLPATGGQLVIKFLHGSAVQLVQGNAGQRSGLYQGKGLNEALQGAGPQVSCAFIRCNILV